MDSPTSALDVLALVPWHEGSHRRWIDGLVRHSRHRVHVLALPAMGWRKGLTVGPAWFADAIATHVAQKGAPDLVLASSPIDLASILGLSRSVLGDRPVVLYLHESQILYPAGPMGGSADGPALLDARSLQAADEWLVASRFHHDALVDALPRFVRDHDGLARPAGGDAWVERGGVVPVGVDLVEGPSGKPSRPGGPTIVWNHRWAHDKNPGPFTHALLTLAAEHAEFSVSLLGPAERSGERYRKRLVDHLGGRVVHAGAPGRTGYEQALADADIVASTAHHEFFGVAVVEALSAGCHPVLPNRLSYPELVPEAGLYEGELVDALRPLLAGWPERRIEVDVSRFAWPVVAPQYDAVFERITGTREVR